MAKLTAKKAKKRVVRDGRRKIPAVNYLPIPATRFYDPVADAGMVFLTGNQAKAAALAIAETIALNWAVGGKKGQAVHALEGALARLEATFELPTFGREF
jgi:hypothetical protein